jgi:hypothetical protein
VAKNKKPSRKLFNITDQEFGQISAKLEDAKNRMRQIIAGSHGEADILNVHARVFDFIDSWRDKKERFVMYMYALEIAIEATVHLLTAQEEVVASNDSDPNPEGQGGGNGEMKN